MTDQPIAHTQAAEFAGPFEIPLKPHNHAGGEACPGCLTNMMLVQDTAFTAGAESVSETLATARSVSDMYFLRTKALAAVLLDARGLVRGLDSALDERIDTALREAGFLSESSTPPASGGAS